MAVRPFGTKCAMLAAATSGVVLGWDGVPAHAVAPTYNYTMLSGVHTTQITALPLNSPPINGFIPRVVLGLTNKQVGNITDYDARQGSLQEGVTLPGGGPPQFFSVATLDSGAQSSILSLLDSPSYNLQSVGREGTYPAEIIGASGTETVLITDALGVYVTGLSNATVSGGSTIGVNTATLQGQWNTSILKATDPLSELPNIVGSPMLAQYQTIIDNTHTRRLTVGTNTYTSPEVSFRAVDSPVTAPEFVAYSRLTLDPMGPNGVIPNPTFIPDPLLGFNGTNGGNNPSAPTFWAALMASSVNVSGTGGSANNQQFLFDTGAEVTVLSQDTAAAVGYYSGGPNPSTPDFTVEVSGVGGTSQNVPGFYLPTLSFLTNGGPMTWTNIPVLVLDVPDPRDAVGFVPGILGMNLFTDRDLVLNGGTFNPSLYISPARTARWSVDANGNWGEDLKWVLGVPDSEDKPANFLNGITAPRTITVDGSYTAGSMKFDNANRYTIAGGGGGAHLTLARFSGPATIDVVSGSHTISAPVTLDDNLVVTVTPAASVLTISSDVTASGKTITKAGAGRLEMKNVRADGVSVTGGKLAIISGAGNGGTSVVKGAPTISGGGQLDIADSKLVVDYTGATPIAAIKGQILAGRNGTDFAGGNWNGSGIASSTAAASDLVSFAVGYVDNSFLPSLGLPSYTAFGGQTVDSSSVLVRYTRGADANLDGRVNTDDVTIVGALYNNVGSGEWFLGDFDYDGKCDTDDVTVLGAMYDATAPALSEAQLSAQFGLEFAEAFERGRTSGVPEPAMALWSGLLLLAKRRRRRAVPR